MPPNDTVVLVGPIGTEREASPSEVAELLAIGYRRADPREAKRFQLKKHYGTTGHTLAAAGSGVARGLTGGLSDIAFAKAGAGKTLQNYDLVHPGLRLGGEVVGTLGALAIPGAQEAAVAKGAGLLARGGRAIAAVPRAGAAAGQLAERGVARVLGKGALSSAAGAATEGALMMGAHEVAESYVYDREISKEAIGSAMMGGGLFGGVVGGTVGLMGRALGKFKGLAPTEEGLVGVLDKTYGRGSRVAAKLLGAPAEAAEKLLAPGAMGREARALAMKADDVRLAAANKIAGDLGEVVELNQALRSAVMRRGGNKMKTFSKLMDAGDDIGRLKQSMGMLERAKMVADDMVSDPVKYGSWDGLGMLAKETNRTIEMARRIGAEGGEMMSAKLYHLVDEYKANVLKKYIKNSKRWGANGNPGGYDIHHRLWDDLYDGILKPGLEDSAVWGRAAHAQKAINAQWVDDLQANPDRELFTRNFLQRYARSGFEGPKYRVNPDLVHSFSKSLLDPTKSTKLASLKAELKSNVEFAKAMQDTMDLTPAQAKAFKLLSKKSEAVLKSVDESMDALTVKGQLDELLAHDKKSGALVGLATGGVLGSVMGGEGQTGLGAGLGAIAGAFSRPGAAVRRLAAMESAAGKLRGKMKGDLSAIFRRAKRSTPSAAARYGGMVTRPDERSERKALRQYADATGAIHANAVNPDAVRSRVVDMAGTVADADPKQQEALIQQIYDDNKWLLEKMPVTATQQVGRRPNPREAQDFLRLVSALADPANVVARLRNGKVTRGEIDALKERRPAFYTQLREEAAERITIAASKGRKLPYEDRIRIGVLLELHTDPTLDPEFQLAVAESYEEDEREQAERKKAPPRRKRTEVSDELRTASEQIAMEG